MMNEQEHGDSMRRVREWLYNRVSELSMRDYRAAGNPKYSKRTGQRVHVPYALGIDTAEAHEIEKMALLSTWTDEQEEKIKAYKLRTSLLMAAGAIE